MRGLNCRSILSILLLSATACRTGGPAQILLFTGTGTSPNDVAAVENVLDQQRLPFATVNSRRLDRMKASQLRGYRLIIVPGGNFIEIGDHLKPGTTANLRTAVKSGTNYLGICAGGFFAGNTGYNSLNLTSGVRFGFYAAGNRGIRKATVPIASPGAPPLDQYWEDGPQFSGWGTVAATYPDGTPAVVEGTFGSGWIVLSGIHAEAPASWRRGMAFTTPVSADHAYAGMLIQAALNRTPLSR